MNEFLFHVRYYSGKEESEVVSENFVILASAVSAVTSSEL
jgi:hypothetical protein